METLPEMDKIITKITTWLEAELLTTATLLQLTVCIIAILVAKKIAVKPRDYVSKYIKKKWKKSILDRHNEEAIIALIFPVITMVIIWVLYVGTSVLTLPNNLIEIVAKMLMAWVLIRLVSSIVRVPALSSLFASIAWMIAALSIVDLLQPTMDFLDSFAMNVGESRFSVLGALKGIVSLCILLWLAGLLNRLIDKRIRAIPNMTPSVRVLMSKMTKITLMVLAVLIGLQSIGIDLTTLQVFGGAIGLGLGFGLQKVVSNLICGVILLLDRSVKPGDVIQVDDTYGEVHSLGARCVSVLTRDGVEYLIPNENLITQQVTNWSYSSKNVRLKMPIGVSYDADVKKAMAIMDEVARNTPRVLHDPEPISRLIAFGDSAIELELRIWITDPEAGVRNVRSNILLEIWERFKAEGIGLPYPQRDMHLKPTPELELMIEHVMDKKFGH